MTKTPKAGTKRRQRLNCNEILGKHKTSFAAVLLPEVPELSDAGRQKRSPLRRKKRMKGSTLGRAVGSVLSHSAVRG